MIRSYFYAILLLLIFLGQAASAQTTDSLLKPTKKTIDSTLTRTPTPVAGYFRRPTVQRAGASALYTREALRYYGSPITVAQVFEESNEAFPLVLSDVAFGRESAMFSYRLNDPLLSATINGSLPMNDPLTGNTPLNGFALDAFSDIALDRGASGLARMGADYASSDAMNFTIERFRAPIPFSRIHFTQMLAESHSNFDGVFAFNASRSTNIAIGIDRRSSGHAQNQNDPTTNPRIDLWGGRAQISYESFLGKLKTDSTTTARQVDSLLNLPENRANSLDMLLWANYTTVFSALSGGLVAHDSDDIFNRVLATVRDPNSFEHRVRGDVLFQADLPFLGDDRTRISGYFTYSARRLSTFGNPLYDLVHQIAGADRLGASLKQPLALRLGRFLTRAAIEGEVQRIDRAPLLFTGKKLSDTRLSATGYDSLALEGVFGIGLFGFARLVQSNLKIDGSTASSLVLPSVGLSGSVAVSDAMSFTANYTYLKDRAALSLSPTEHYQIRNLAGFLDLHFPLSKKDSVSAHLGVMDRHEPIGVLYQFTGDTIHPVPYFSNADFHSQTGLASLDLYLHHFHGAFNLQYFPAPAPPPAFTEIAAINVAPRQRFFGSAAIYYENELAEGNLRMTIGARVRYLDRLSPALTYDPAIDEFVYRGVPERAFASGAVLKLDDARLETPKGIVDLLVAMEIDRRAQVNISFLNVTAAPYYNVAVYQRTGFQLRIDVTWAFLD